MTTIAEPLGPRAAAAKEPSRRLWLAMWLVLGLIAALTWFLSRQADRLAQEAATAALERNFAVQTQQLPVLLSGYMYVLGDRLTYWSGVYCIVVAVLLLVAVHGWQHPLAP